MTKIGCVAEPEREGNIVIRHFRTAQISQRDIGSQLVGQLSKRRVLHLQAAPKRAR